MNSVKFLSRKIRKTLSDAKYRSKQKKINFDLTYEHLRDMFYHQDAQCFYTGVNFNFDSRFDTPSLDRIDSKKGYTIGNVVWCRSRINFMKYEDTYEEFLAECRSILEYRPSWKMKDQVSDEKLRLQ